MPDTTFITTNIYNGKLHLLIMNKSIDSRSLDQQITSQGYATIPISITQEQFEVAAKSWLNFLTLPQEIKDEFFIENAFPHSHDSIVGYVNSSRSEKEKKGAPIGSTDNKEYFHFNEIAIEDMTEHALQIPQAKEFFKQANILYQESLRLHKAVVNAMEFDNPGIYKAFFGERVPEIYLRFLKYDYDGSGKPVALPHYDRGAQTLALAESTPGLRLHHQLDDEMFRTTYVSKHEGTALFFPGYQLKGMTNGKYKPTAHDVVPLETSAKSNIRWSIVCFADYPNSNPVPYQAVHFDDQSALGKHIQSIPNWQTNN